MSAMWWMALYIGTMSTVFGNLIATIICFYSNIPENYTGYGIILGIFKKRTMTASCGCRVRKGHLLSRCHELETLQKKADKVTKYILIFKIVYFIRMRRVHKHYKQVLKDIGEE